MLPRGDVIPVCLMSKHGTQQTYASIQQTYKLVTKKVCLMTWAPAANVVHELLQSCMRLQRVIGASSDTTQQTERLPSFPLVHWLQLLEACSFKIRDVSCI